MRTSFIPPDEKERKAALGSLAGTKFTVKKHLNAIFNEFQPVKDPEPDDWLATQDETGQPYSIFTSLNQNANKIIYILPLAQDIPKAFLDCLRKFCQAFFFGFEVRFLKGKSLSSLNIPNRMNNGRLQWNACKILQILPRFKPKNGFCILGISMEDLFHKEEWNFIFGLGSGMQGSGVFSFARYDDRFFCEREYTPSYDERMLFRSSMVMVHEIGHMFRILHCIYFDCVMNGSNSLEESEKRTSLLCPICLRKLQSVIEFNILERYKALSEACEELGGYFLKPKEKYDKLIAILESK